MPFTHQLPDWPRLTWDAAALAAPLAAVRHAQGRHLGTMSALGFGAGDEAELESLTVELVRSWAIEGEALDASEVRSSIARRLGLDVGGLDAASMSKPSRRVDGLVQMLLDVTHACFQPLTSERLFGWHAALFPTGRSGIESITVGNWRTADSDPMQVLSGAIGRETVHFEAPAAARVADEMSCFLRWFEARGRVGSPQLDAPDLDPVLRAGLAHLWFITVHPFDDGNGRIARAIADLALARADGTPQRFYSLSAQIEAERRDYYDQLERAQRGTCDVTEWLAWFIGCLGRAIERAGGTLERVRRASRVWSAVAKLELNDRQRQLIERLLGDFEGNLTSSKAAKLTKCSPDTALRDLKQLVAWGVLERGEAGGRSTAYRLVVLEEG
ncbi:Adenosine monophosphate-protein transferase SoFic [Planctomycetes bacterium Pla163]|uniref:Adenosine monophosphate-protein transferase SoFic n=1 Tax=Rohdeia mirabilis TaxID=2528008 RepID=A0A518CVB8_9BACT|nr:Adenosine monophosphate-protein transferase SoFic [Planctomycetes bacterium Pla163]